MYALLSEDWTHPTP